MTLLRSLGNSDVELELLIGLTVTESFKKTLLETIMNKKRQEFITNNSVFNHNSTVLTISHLKYYWVDFYSNATRKDIVMFSTFILFSGQSLCLLVESLGLLRI
jgi:hypothetical protein